MRRSVGGRAQAGYVFSCVFGVKSVTLHALARDCLRQVWLVLGRLCIIVCIIYIKEYINVFSFFLCLD